MTKSGSHRKKTAARATKTTRAAVAEKRTQGSVAASLPPAHTIPRAFAGFDRERATYSRLRSSLLTGGEGKYVAIVGDEIVGPLGSHEEAERAGYKRFGLGPLYVKQILA